MKSKLFCVIAIVLVSGNILANKIILSDSTKNIFPVTGHHALMIDIDPIFVYIGNMFNGSDYNSLNLNTSNFLYRKYENESKVTRYRLRFYGDFTQSRRVKFDEFPANLLNGSSKDNFYSITFAKGSEKHFNYKKLSLYYGSEILIGGSYLATSYNYDFQDGDIIKDAYSLIIDRRI